MILDTSLPYLQALELPTPFPVGPVTVYVAHAPGEPLTLIDTGPLTAETRLALEGRMAGLGHSLSSLERIIITHAHVDHCGLAADLAALSGAQVWTHPWNIPELGDYEASRDIRMAFYAQLLQRSAVPREMMQAVGWVTQAMRRFARPVGVDVALEEGTLLRLAGRQWRVLHTPGHAGGLICLYDAGSRTLLSSDHLLADISSNPVVEPPRPGSHERYRSLAQYRASLERVAAMDIAQALPSHGPIIRDIAGLVRQRLGFHRARLERVLDALCAGARTTWDVTCALFPGRSPLDTFLALSEVIGHLEVLEMEGQIVDEEDGGVTHWRLAAAVAG